MIVDMDEILKLNKVLFVMILLLDKLFEWEEWFKRKGFRCIDYCYGGDEVYVVDFLYFMILFLDVVELREGEYVIG